MICPVTQSPEGFPAVLKHFSVDHCDVKFASCLLSVPLLFGVQTGALHSDSVSAVLRNHMVLGMAPVPPSPKLFQRLFCAGIWKPPQPSKGCGNTGALPGPELISILAPRLSPLGPPGPHSHALFPRFKDGPALSLEAPHRFGEWVTRCVCVGSVPPPSAPSSASPHHQRLSPSVTDDQAWTRPPKPATFGEFLSQHKPEVSRRRKKGNRPPAKAAPHVYRLGHKLSWLPIIPSFPSPSQALQGPSVICFPTCACMSLFSTAPTGKLFSRGQALGSLG